MESLSPSETISKSALEIGQQPDLQSLLWEAHELSTFLAEVVNVTERLDTPLNLSDCGRLGLARILSHVSSLAIDAIGLMPVHQNACKGADNE
jgi:hypothetical protein